MGSGTEATIERLRLIRGLVLTVAVASAMLGVSSLGLGIANPKAAIFEWTQLASRGVVAYVFLPAMIVAAALAAIASALQVLIQRIRRHRPAPAGNLTKHASRRGPRPRG
jgi:hypothetical protein